MTQDIQAELRMIREMLSWLRNEERFREEILGVPAAPSGQSGQAPEPASRLGHSETVPSAADAVRGFIARNTGWYMSNDQVATIIVLARDQRPVSIPLRGRIA
jgi:hypothetical protein